MSADVLEERHSQRKTHLGNEKQVLQMPQESGLDQSNKSVCVLDCVRGGNLLDINCLHREIIMLS